MPRHFSSFHRIAAFLALFGMLVPVAVGVWHHPAVVLSATHICGVAHSGDPNHAPGHKLPPCPVCQHLHLLSGGFVPPQAVGIGLLTPRLAMVVMPQVEQVTRRDFVPQARPRAPPSFV